jgi:structural maintenance of chromosome 4
VPPTLAQRGMPSAGGAAEMAAITDATQASLKILEAEALTGLNKAKLELQISVVEDERDEMKSRVDMTAIAVYETKAREQQVKLDELRRSTELRDGARADLDELRKQRFQCFDEGFAIIKTRLKEIYRMLTRGGDAELVSVDSLDPFSEGIKFSVRPPRKCWKEISNLSGGEKTLCSLALVFAMHYFRPTPLYVMDEIDAALDFKNVSIIANYIKERTENAQFIVISLRNNMFEVADRLVGIYKTHNATKSITINPKELAKQLKSGAAKRAAAQLAAQAAPLPLGDATNAGRL